MSSSTSVSRSRTYWSHQDLCSAVLFFHSFTSNLLSLEARYIRAMAITSGSHCRHRVVHKLSLTKVQDI